MTRGLAAGGVEQITRNYWCNPKKFNSEISKYLSANYQELEFKNSSLIGFEYFDKNGNKTEIILDNTVAITQSQDKKHSAKIYSNVLISMHDNRPEVIKGLEKILKK